MTNETQKTLEVGDRVEINCLGRRSYGTVTEGDMGLTPASYRVFVPEDNEEYYFYPDQLTYTTEGESK